jgi:uncharacterized protein HemX
MNDYLRKMFSPTKEDLIQQYEEQIKRKEKELESLKEYVEKLKGQKPLKWWVG